MSPACFIGSATLVPSSPLRPNSGFDEMIMCGLVEAEGDDLHMMDIILSLGKNARLFHGPAVRVRHAVRSPSRDEQGVALCSGFA
ncbi:MULTISPECIES: hypothetical protein [Burkholderia cepacia complex]|uniref:hypothetical protein n=1 Tax=Burkholderia cepacia complex TaxID=87882 RepID=UPI000AD440B7|nr:MULTISPECIES: hypothetical protein [Burkholderia cepacia complex]